MKQFKSWIPMCILFSLMLSLTSCQGLIDAIFGEHVDNPTESTTGGGGDTPTPAPAPAPVPKKDAEITAEVSEIYIWEGDSQDRLLSTTSDGEITVSSADESCATVTFDKEKGLMTVKAIKKPTEGDFVNITATVPETGNYKSATLVIPVRIFVISDFITLVTGLTLDKSDLDLTRGSEYTLKATLDPAGPAGESVYDPSVLWKSADEKVATVDENGKVTAIATGKTTITATANNFGQEDVKAVCNVSVTTPVTGIEAERGSIDIIEGYSAEWRVMVIPEDADDKSITYKSSDTKVVTIDQNGIIQAVNSGTATLTATSNDGGFVTTCEVNVAYPISSLVLDQDKFDLKKGDSYTLKATFLPEEAGDKTIIWKSDDEKVATVDQNGKVTAVDGGTTRIYAIANNFGQQDVKASCEVHVIIPVTSIESERGSVTVEKGHTNHMNTTIYPANADDKKISYKSSDPKVVIIDQNGDYKTISGGTATLTAITHDGGFEASCTVFVTVSVTGVTISKTELHMVEGNTAPLSATIAPADALNQKVTWTSSDNTTAKVDANGLVTALKPGNVVITVTTDEYGYSAKCTVTIDKLLVPSTAVSLNYSTLPLSMGETGTLIATMSPSNTTDAVSFTSADEKIAKVDAKTGVVTAMSVGTTTITATTTSGQTATCTVVVTALVPTPTDYSGGGDPFK